MLGRELQLPLDRLRASVTAPRPAHVRDRVHHEQRQMKQRFDKTRRVRTPPFTALDWVRIRRPHRGHKLQSFWSAPMQITDQLGPATFRLSDGSRWHASRLRRVTPPASMDAEVPETVTPPAAAGAATGMRAYTDFDFDAGDIDLPQIRPQAPEVHPALPVHPPAHDGHPVVPAARPARRRARPDYLKDFVTDF